MIGTLGIIPVGKTFIYTNSGHSHGRMSDSEGIAMLIAINIVLLLIVIGSYIYEKCRYKSRKVLFGDNVLLDFSFISLMVISLFEIVMALAHVIKLAIE